ncbi:hypothetical protein SAY87_005159 [Trapa incisa]|uniref:Uncharacterized protein n=1 Tax=Trapa incisa TaxID=236973 RepID=A0AAN7K9D5_9MYRT|nr:hypothetical protein SAY87_005159 [Trapa incisa]
MPPERSEPERAEAVGEEEAVQYRKGKVENADDQGTELFEHRKIIVSPFRPHRFVREELPESYHRFRARRAA